jgi:hypothetical protein
MLCCYVSNEPVGEVNTAKSAEMEMEQTLYYELALSEGKTTSTGRYFYKGASGTGGLS